MTIAENTEHVAEGLALLLAQFIGATKVEELLTVCLNEIQVLDGVTYDLYSERLLDTAVGAQLDVLGLLVNQSRLSSDDDEYRSYIRARIAVNHSHGTINELIHILRLITTLTDEFEFIEYSPAAMTIEVQEQVTQAMADIMLALMLQAKAAGVNLQLLYSLQEEDYRFQCSSQSGTVEYSPLKGFAATDAEIQSSTDGIAWTHRTPDDYYAGTLIGVCWDGTAYIAVGSSGEIQTSPDGAAWTHRDPAVSFSGSFNAVAPGAARLVAVGSSGEIQTSDDNGATWTHRTSGETVAFMDVAYDGSSLNVAVGINAIIRTSPDGITWTARTPGGGYGSSLRGAATNGTTLYVIVGNIGEIQTSPDAITWTHRTSGTSQALYGVCYASSLYVVVGANGTILTSSDGTTWTARTSGTAETLQKVTHDGSQFVVVGDAGTILTSSDGITWAEQTPAGELSSNIYDVCYGSSLLLLTGSARTTGGKMIGVIA